MTTELRLYTVNKGMMDEWVAAFNKYIMPTSDKFGIRIHFGFVNAPLFATFLLGMFWRRATLISTSPISPNKMRNATSVNGPVSATAILIHKNEEPHTKPNNPNTAHCFMVDCPLSFAAACVNLGFGFALRAAVGAALRHAGLGHWQLGWQACH